MDALLEAAKIIEIRENAIQSKMCRCSNNMKKTQRSIRKVRRLCFKCYKLKAEELYDLSDKDKIALNIDSAKILINIFKTNNS